MDPVKVGLLGLGTVGAGTVNVLARNAAEIKRRAGRGIVVSRAAVRDPDRPRPLLAGPLALTTSAAELVDDPEIAVVVELIGGIEPALSLVQRALANGKHVVTANKALVALHGNEIFDAAQRAGVMVAFEAAVAGGIPLIKTLREGLAGNHIERISGIINGTANYVLTHMRGAGKRFEDVLAEAQRLGYAEADPRFDVEGVDAAHKLTILASIAFGIPLQFSKVYTEGISAITPEDIASASELGYRIKHLGLSRRTTRGVELRVHPTFVPDDQLLARVDGVMNAVLIDADAVGPTLYHGAGAGAEPTASAVVADLVDVVRTLTADPGNRVPHLAFQPDALADLPVLGIEDVETAYYLRMKAVDRPGVLAEVASILGEAGISIEAITQREPDPGATHVTVILLTHRVVERRMNDALSRIEALESIAGKVTRIRLERFEVE